MIAHDDEQAIFTADPKAAEGIVGGSYRAFAHRGFPALHSPTQGPSLQTNKQTYEHRWTPVNSRYITRMLSVCLAVNG